MKRRTSGWSFSAVTLFTLLLAATVHADGAAEAKDKAAEANAAAQRILDRPVPEVNFNGNALSDIIDFMRDVTGANIFVNWKALEEAKIKKDAPVTLRIKNASTSKVIDLILRDAAGEKNKLAWVVDEGVITISTSADLQKTTATRTYDVRFLIGNDKIEPADVRQRRVDAAIKMLTGSIDPKSWHVNGGPAGAVKELSGQLIVTQTPDNQKLIANLLEQLKVMREAK